MLGAKLTGQSIDEKGGLCDKMEVSTDAGRPFTTLASSRFSRGAIGSERK